MATEDDERTVADRVKATELEIPAAGGSDDEATQLNPPPHQLRPTGEVDTLKPTQAEMPKTDVGPMHVPSKPPVPDDDDATQARPPAAFMRKKAPPEPPQDDTRRHPMPPPPPPNYYSKDATHTKERRTGTDEYTPRKSLHPVVVLSVGIAVLFLLLLGLNWVRTSHVLDGTPDEPVRFRR